MANGICSGCFRLIRRRRVRWLMVNVYRLVDYNHLYRYNRRCAGPTAPAAEMGQIDIRSIFPSPVRSHHIARMLPSWRSKIKLHPLLEIFPSPSNVIMNDFRTLFINGEGVEAIHFDYLSGVG